MSAINKLITGHRPNHAGGLILALEVDGERREVIARPEFAVVPQAAHVTEPIETPRRWVPESSPLDALVDTLAWGALLRDGLWMRWDLPHEWGTREVRLPTAPPFDSLGKSLRLWDRLVGVLRPAIGMEGLPPADIAARVAVAAEAEPDPMVRALGLGFALAIGQEAWILAAAWGRTDVPDERRKAWLEVGHAWVGYLESRRDVATDLRVVLTGESAAEQFASAWLPAATILRQGHRLAMGRKRREDFVTLLGLRLPWEGHEDALWLRPDRDFRDRHRYRDERWYLDDYRTPTPMVFCDPWPYPLDHFPWWRDGLSAAAEALLWAPVSEDEMLDLRVPWHAHALAATAAVSASFGHSVSKAALHDLAKRAPSPGSCPNHLRPEAARLIGTAAQHVGPGYTYEAPVVALPRATRNLAADVEWALRSRDRFRRVNFFETSLLLWWHSVLFQPHEQVIPEECLHHVGRDWRLEKIMESVVRGVAAPTSFVKGGWLRHVIALYARNGAWPADERVPHMDALEKYTPDLGVEQDLLDTAERPFGTEDVADWRNGQTTELGYSPLRKLALAGWFLKPAAKTRILDILKRHRPVSPRTTAWEQLAIPCAIAAARLIHVVRDTEVIVAFNAVRDAAAALAEDDIAVRTAKWLDRFLRETGLFPSRPQRR